MKLRGHDVFKRPGPNPERQALVGTVCSRSYFGSFERPGLGQTRNRSVDAAKGDAAGTAEDLRQFGKRKSRRSASATGSHAAVEAFDRLRRGCPCTSSGAPHQDRGAP